MSTGFGLALARGRRSGWSASLFVPVLLLFAAPALSVAPAAAGPFDVIVADSTDLTLCQGCGITLAGLGYGLIVNTGSSDITLADLGGATFSVRATRPDIVLFPFINIPNPVIVSAIHPGEAMGSIIPGNELLLPLIRPGETLRNLAGLQFMAYEVERDTGSYAGPIRWDVEMTMAGMTARFAIRAQVHLGLHNIVFLTATRVSAGSANHPPDCAGAVASIPSLRPPNGQMIPIDITGVTDPDGDSVTVNVTGITQDEPIEKRGKGGCADGQIVDGAASVRAQRTGGGNGRVYSIQFTARDPFGAQCQGAVSVCVPAKPGLACVDDGQIYSSTQDCASDSVPKLATRERDDEIQWQSMVENAMASGAGVEVDLFDISGRRVARLGRDFHPAFFQSRSIPGVNPGVYFLRVRVGGQQVSRKIYLAQN